MTNAHHIYCIEDEVDIQEIGAYNLGRTSLGLTIVTHVAPSHKGSLEFKSEINQVSTFLVEIPLDSDIN